MTTWIRKKSIASAAALLAGAALAPPTPVAAGGGASLSGVVRSGPRHAPLVGARVLAGDSRSHEVFSSAPTGDDGTFEIAGLPGATYEIAVEVGGGLYLVEAPVALPAGERRAVGISVGAATEAGDDDEGEGGDDGGGTRPDQGSGGSGLTFLNNPATAAFFVLGLAIIFGYLIENATDDKDAPGSPFEV